MLIAIPLVILFAIPAVAKVLFRGHPPAAADAEFFTGLIALLVGCLLTVPATWLSGMPVSEAFGGNMMAGILGTAGVIWFAGDEMVLLALRMEQLPFARLRTVGYLTIVVAWPLVTPPVISYAFGLTHWQ